MVIETVYVKGKNSIGKTQWMYMNIGCFPDQKFSDRFTNIPINEYLYVVNLLPEPYKLPVYIYSSTKINTENSIIDKLESVSCKVLIHVTSDDLIIPVFRQLQKIQMTELYINNLSLIRFQALLKSDYSFYDLTLGSVKTESLIFPDSLKTIFIEVRTNDQILTIEKADGTKFVSNNTMESIKANLLLTLETKLKKIEKKIQQTQTNIDVLTKNINELYIKIGEIRTKTHKNNEFFVPFTEQIRKAYKDSKKKDLNAIEAEVDEKLQYIIPEYQQHMELSIQLRQSLHTLETEMETWKNQFPKKSKIIKFEELKSEREEILQKIKIWRTYNDH